MKNLHIAIIGNGRLGKLIASRLNNPTLIDSKTPLSSISWDKIDLFIDVSQADVIASFLPHILLTKKPLIVGSSGHKQGSITLLKKASQTIPLLLACNFSYGIYLLKKLLKHMPPPTRITDIHHIHKKDAPSGTAKEIMNQYEDPPHVESVREGETFGTHKVHYEFFEEEIEITHKAHSRDLFAEGAIKAIEFLYEKEPGFYTMDDVYTKDEICKKPLMKS